MPKRVITANDTKVAKHLNEAVQLLRLMERPNITVVRKDINDRYGVNIPYHTLRNCFLGITRPYKEAHRSQQLLSPEAERVLVDWILFYSDTSHPLSKRTIRKKARCICGKRPSRGWIYSFLGRWPEITLGKPSGLDPKRAQAFNRPVVEHCFEQLDDLVKRYNIKPWNMYNMDEKGCQRGGGRKASSRKYFVPRTRRPKYKQRSGNLELVTIIECVCADGTSLNPGFVFQGKEFCPEWFEVDDNIIISTSENGWTSDFLCAEWFEKSFIPQATARNTSNTPILLIYDGHGSHESLKIIDLAISHGIILFCLPPHTTHMLQPLDVGVFGPFSRAWADRCDEVLEDTDEEMPREDFVKEYMAVRSATFKESTIKQAFRKSGCCPVNPEVFTEQDFAPSIPTSISARHVPSSYPVSDNNSANDFYATDEEGDEPEATRDDDSDAEDEPRGCDDDDEENEESAEGLSANIPVPAPPPAVHDPFGFLTDARIRIRIRQSQTPSTSSTSPLLPPPPSISSVSSPRPTPVPPASFYALNGSSHSRPRRSNKSAGSSQRKKAKSRLEQLEERIAQLESEATTMQTHLSMAEDDIQTLKRKQNARDHRSSKRPKLNVDARTLTSAHGRQAAAEKEASKEAEQQKKQMARDQREAEEEERQRARLTRDPNHAFSGALGSKSRPDLVDIAYALQLREVTHSKEKLTKKDIQDFINTHFDLHPEKRQDPRFEGLFNSRRRPRVNENSTPGAGPSVVPPPSTQPHALPQSSNAHPLSSNMSNVLQAPFPAAGQFQPYAQPQLIYSHQFAPGPYAANPHVPYHYPYPY